MKRPGSGAFDATVLLHAESASELPLSELVTVVGRFEYAGFTFPEPIPAAVDLVGLREVSPHDARRIVAFMQDRFEDWEAALAGVWSVRAREGLQDGGAEGAELYAGLVAGYQAVRAFFDQVGTSSTSAVVVEPAWLQAPIADLLASRSRGREPGPTEVRARQSGSGAVRACSYCGRPGEETVLSDFKGRAFPTVLCDICVDLYGSGSQENWRSYQAAVVPTSSTEEGKRLEAGTAVRRELAGRPLRPAHGAAEVDEERRLVGFNGRCQWCGIVDMVTAHHQVWADPGSRSGSREELSRQVARRSDLIHLYWLHDDALVQANEAEVGLVLLRVLAHPDPDADAGPTAVVDARHPLRLLCTACKKLIIEVPAGGDTHFAHAIRAALLLTFEQRLRHPEFRSQGVG